MDHIDYPTEFDEWLDYTKSRMREDSDFIGDHRYRHFDGYVTHDALYSNQSALAGVLRDPNKLVSYSFHPFIRRDKKVRRFTRDKSKGVLKVGQKIRPIMYASHHDACIYAFYAYMLKKAYETRIAGSKLADSVVAYRHIPRPDAPDKGKSNIDLAKDVSMLAKKHDRCVVLCLDVSKFFDSMDHNFIKERWCKLINTTRLPNGHYIVFKNITKYRYVFLYEALVKLGYGQMRDGKFEYAEGTRRQGILCTPLQFRTNIDSKRTGLVHKNKSDIGIPQGSPISDIIANIYLENFDRGILAQLETYNFGYYKRYSDDILIICPEDKASEAYELAVKSITAERLVIKPQKSEAVLIDNQTKIVTDITYQLTGHGTHTNSMREAFQYLGFEIDARDLHLRPGTIANHYRRALRRTRAITAKKPGNASKTLKRKTSSTKSNRSRWQYFISAQQRTGSTRIKAQYKRALKRVRSFSNRAS